VRPPPLWQMERSSAVAGLHKLYEAVHAEEVALRGQQGSSSTKAAAGAGAGTGPGSSQPVITSNPEQRVLAWAGRMGLRWRLQRHIRELDELLATHMGTADGSGDGGGGGGGGGGGLQARMRTSRELVAELEPRLRRWLGHGGSSTSSSSGAAMTTRGDWSRQYAGTSDEALVDMLRQAVVEAEEVDREAETASAARTPEYDLLVEQTARVEAEMQALHAEIRRLREVSSSRLRPAPCPPSWVAVAGLSWWCSAARVSALSLSAPLTVDRWPLTRLAPRCSPARLPCRLSVPATHGGRSWRCGALRWRRSWRGR
jgi:hypothetical protein